MVDELERHVQEEKERQKLRERAVFDERERIARELHDGFAQVLGYVNTKVMAVRLLVKESKLKEADQQLIHLENAAKGLFVEVREAILGLKMAGRMQTNLSEALSEYVDDFSQLSGIPTSFKAMFKQENGIIPADAEIHLFRIVQESLNNIRKHANASKAWIELSETCDGLRLEICDNGTGFDNEVIERKGKDQFGLNNMSERAKEIGAQFQIIASIGEGTRILIDLPQDKSEKTS
jgi:signal transduction histidine kinase